MNELKLLKGDPIEVIEGLNVYPLILSDIVELGEDIYNSLISSIMMNNSILSKIENNTIPKNEIDKMYKLNELEFITCISIYYPYIFQSFMSALRLFLRSNIEIIENVGLIILNDNGSFLLDNDLFIKIKEIIAKQNFIKYKEETSYKPANSKAKALLEKMNKIKENIKNQNKEEGLSLRTVISIVSNYSNDINIKSVWDLTVLQLYESYIRILIWDDYHNQYMLLPHMDENSKREVSNKHWAKDINKIN